MLHEYEWRITKFPKKNLVKFTILWRYFFKYFFGFFPSVVSTSSDLYALYPCDPSTIFLVPKRGKGNDNTLTYFLEDLFSILLTLTKMISACFFVFVFHQLSLNVNMTQNLIPVQSIGLAVLRIPPSMVMIRTQIICLAQKTKENADSISPARK